MNLWLNPWCFRLNKQTNKQSSVSKLPRSFILLVRLSWNGRFVFCFCFWSKISNLFTKWQIKMQTIATCSILQQPSLVPIPQSVSSFFPCYANKLYGTTVISTSRKKKKKSTHSASVFETLESFETEHYSDPGLAITYRYNTVGKITQCVQRCVTLLHCLIRVTMKSWKQKKWATLKIFSVWLKVFSVQFQCHWTTKETIQCDYHCSFLYKYFLVWFRVFSVSKFSVWFSVSYFHSDSSAVYNFTVSISDLGKYYANNFFFFFLWTNIVAIFFLNLGFLIFWHLP